MFFISHIGKRCALQMTYKIARNLRTTANIEKTMAFNERLPEMQKQMHQETLLVQQQRWPQEAEEARVFKEAMDRSVQIMESLSRSLDWISQPVMPSAIHVEPSDGNIIAPVAISVQEETLRRRPRRQVRASATLISDIWHVMCSTAQFTASLFYNGGHIMWHTTSTSTALWFQHTRRFNSRK